jgi:predicted ATPase/DNA-binding SARP family transcriptional activator
VVSPLALYLLGPPRIERDGIPLKLDRRKAMALAAYLAVTGQSRRRDSLVDLLWPDSDAGSGRAALRRTLFALNAAVGADWLDADREEIGLKPGTELWVDVDQFRRRLTACLTHGHPPSEVCPSCVRPLTEAVALARGEFLSGFSLKDSFNFDDWQLFQADLLHRELDGVLQRLVQWHSAQREFEPAEGYARRRLALDPLDEDAHRQLMRLYAWSGRRSAALRQYQDCVAILEDQLGVQPQEETANLYSAIQEGRSPPLPDRAQARQPGVPSKPLPNFPSFLQEETLVEMPVFVAREPELARLGRFLDLALSRQGRVAFVTGESGSGKTTLLQEFSQRAQEAHPDLVVASGNCIAYTGIGDPYLPFRQILALLTGDVEAQWAAGAMTREHARRLWSALPLTTQALVDLGPDLMDTFVLGASLLERAEMCVQPIGGADWLNRLAALARNRPTAVSGAPGAQQSSLFQQYTRVLSALSQRMPLFLLLDDLQWADLGSISLFFHLGRHVAGSRILIVGAYRPEEVAAGRLGARHPLETVVNEFQCDLGDITMDLGQAEGRGFVDGLLDSEPNQLGPSFRGMLYRQTRGHPLFTIELLRSLQERGDLLQDDEGRWVEGPALHWAALPARVEAAIRERIGRLDQPSQAALRVASVEGEVFTAEVVARVQATDERQMLAHLSDALDHRHRLIRAQSVGRLGSQRVSRYRFRNYLFQKYLYDNLDAVERAYLHEDVGKVLEKLHESQAGDLATIAPQLAWHFQEAGITGKAIHYLQQAGERAVQMSAYQEAITHVTRGLALLLTTPNSPERDQQELSLQLTRGIAQIGHGQFAQEAGSAYARALQLGQQAGQTAQLCQALGEMAVYHYVRAEHHRARDLAEQALSQAQRAQDQLLVAWSHWLLGFVSFGMGEYPAARAHLEHAIAYVGPEPPGRFFARLPGADAGLSALAYSACCLWCLGYPEQAFNRSQEAVLLARELDHAFTLADVLCYGACALGTMRRDAQSLQENAEALLQLAENAQTWLPPALWHLGAAAIMIGQVDEAMALMRQSVAVHRVGGKGIYLPVVFGFMAEAKGKAGNPEEGLSMLAEALTLVEETDERHWEAELRRLRAELLLVQGDEAGAEASLRKALDVARRQSARSWELRATTTLAHLWQHQGRIDEARQILSEIYGWFTEGFDTVDLIEARALLEELG